MKAVLAFSGGLDTSVAIRILQEKYDCDVITVTVDVGQPKASIKEAEIKAKKLGVIKHYTIDAKAEFTREFLFPAIKANATYEGYPLGTALARPLIAVKTIEVAGKENAEAIAHGCTGKGNDQFRFEFTIRTKAPGLKIIAPIRDLNLTRKEEIEYAKEKGIPIQVDLNKPFSVDENLWSRSIEGGILEDPAIRPKETIYEWTISAEKAPDKPKIIEIKFERGVPVSLDGKKMAPVELIQVLRALAGKHGIGRIDIIENRIIGLKAREVYEAPAALTLITAHKQLESLVLTKDELKFKEVVDSTWSELTYKGLWFDPFKEDLDAYINKTQERVTGETTIKLFKGALLSLARSSPFALYAPEVVSFDVKSFDQREVAGMLKFHGFQAQLFESKRKKLKSKP
ncbi:MAG: argininosuccinate synthase [Euryarchaeota archaeon]|nr:argininosuccinate synthase [Euryarchaeota archaeon]